MMRSVDMSLAFNAIATRESEPMAVAVVRALASNGPLADSGIARVLDISARAATRHRGQAHNMGWLVWSGEIAATPTNSRPCLWALTGKGRARVRAASRRRAPSPRFEAYPAGVVYLDDNGDPIDARYDPVEAHR